MPPTPNELNQGCLLVWSRSRGECRQLAVEQPGHRQHPRRVAPAVVPVEDRQALVEAQPADRVLDF